MAHISVEFFSAVHNRTGKYFIGRDIIESNRSAIAALYFGRLTKAALPPPNLIGRLAVRLNDLEMRRRACGAWRPVPLLRPRLPTLHLDPLSVVNHELRPTDVVLIHDIGPVTHPHLFEARIPGLYLAAYRKIAQSGCRCVFDSQASLRAFVERFGAARSMQVIYPPLRTELQATPEPVDGLAGPFLLTVGSIGARKGQLESVRGFARSGLAARGVRYVVCGGVEQPGAAEALAECARTEGVVRLPYVSDAQLAWLYRNAAGFLLASHLEGFGVPVAEAMAFGLPPAVTANSVLEEVAGPACLTLDPADLASIAAAMIRLVDMPEAERIQRRAAMQAQLKRYSLPVFLEQWTAVIDSMTNTIN